MYSCFDQSRNLLRCFEEKYFAKIFFWKFVGFVITCLCTIANRFEKDLTCEINSQKREKVKTEGQLKMISVPAKMAAIC